MAEGDTIHRLAARLGEALAEPITSTRSPAPESPLRRQSHRLARLLGARLEDAEPRGKHLLLHFDSGLVLHSHLGMGGSWRLAGPGGGMGRPPSRAHALLASGDRAAGQFGGRTLALRTAAEIRADPVLRSLGPDMLAPDLDLDRAAAALRDGDPAAPVGEALLDQRLLAGVGNIFKSEGCFAAGIDPWRPAGDLDDAQLREVVAMTRRLMSEAVRSGRRPKRVYRRAGRPCSRCGTAIRSLGQGDANRATYWCAGCQR